MSVELAPRTGLIGQTDEQGLRLPADLTFDEWTSVVRLADRIAAASSWWLADALTYGEDRWHEDYSQALPTAEEDPFGASQARMKQALWMGRVYPPGTRVPGASYTHHRIVADLPSLERRQMLSRVADAAQAVARGDDGARPISTRALAKQANERKDALAGGAVTAGGDAVDAPLPALLTEDDLTDAARAALEQHAPIGRQRVAYVSGWLRCVQWNEQRDNVRDERWPE